MTRSVWALAALAGGIAATLAISGCGAPSGGGSSGGTSQSPSGSAPATVSQYDSGPRAGAEPADAAAAAAGEKLFQTKGCSACHAFGRKVTGPDLAGVSMRRTRTWIENQILHPDVMTKTDPIARELFAKHALQMPNQGLTPDEARSVIEFFKHRDQQAGLQPEAAK